MATVINTPASREDSGAGWAAALIIVAALIIIGLFVWPGFVRQSAPAAPGANINVTLPEAPAPVAPAASAPAEPAPAVPVDGN